MNKRWTAWFATLVVMWAVWLAWPRKMTWVRSPLTDKLYYVKNLPDKQQAADRLAFMELRVRDFLQRAAAYAPGDPRLANIQRRWNGTLAETTNDADVAYSIGKDAVSMCVRREDGSLEAENTGMFVLLHEFAHLATDQYGHPPEFWANMKFLLELAEATGVYTYEDFDSTYVSYCGRKLAASPLSCIKSGTCTSELKQRR